MDTDAGQVSHQLPVQLAFRLSAPSAAVTVGVVLRVAGERWVARTQIDGELHVGLGANPRQALQAALAALDNRVSVALLADPALFGVSRQLLQTTPA